MREAGGAALRIFKILLVTAGRPGKQNNWNLTPIICGDKECWAYLPTTQADKVSTWALDGAAQMHVRLVRHVSSSGRIRVLATSLDQRMASISELADLYHGRWRIEEAFKRLKHRLGLESVSGLS